LVVLPSCRNDLDNVAAVEVPAAAADRVTTGAEYIMTDSGKVRNRLRAGRISEWTGEPQRTEIDDGLEQPGVLRARHVPPGDVTDRASYDEEIARNAGPALADADAIMSSLQRNSPTMRDLENLFAGITYMRYLEGEKHLVFLTPQGLQLPRKENSETIARLASDARVALDVVHTHGMIGPPPSTARVSFNLPTADMIFNMRWKVENSRLMSELTGGETAAFRYGDQTFARLDESTRAQYLLGYAPSNGNWDGRYRKVRVTVNRPGVKVLSRQGYYGHRTVGTIAHE
jgi:VWFA-related protein